MTRNSTVAIVAVILGVFILFWVLKIAFKLLLFGVVAAVLIGGFYAITRRIGGPRA